MLDLPSFRRSLQETRSSPISFCAYPMDGLVGDALAECETLSEAGVRILKELCQILDWVIGVLWTVDRSRDVLRCVEVWHLPSPEVADIATAT